MNDVPAINTDCELWRKVPGDYYSPSIFVTENGSIGINVGGLVLVAYVEAWFKAGQIAWCVEPPNMFLHPTAFGVRLRWRFGQWLVRFGNYLARNGGG